MVSRVRAVTGEVWEDEREYKGLRVVHSLPQRSSVIGYKTAGHVIDRF